MKVTVTKALSSYFNDGPGKRKPTEFLQELRALAVEEKLELAKGVVAITGDELES
jgi:hypothetical protein